MEAAARHELTGFRDGAIASREIPLAARGSFGDFFPVQQWLNRNQARMRIGGIPISHATPYFMRFHLPAAVRNILEQAADLVVS